jgi:hypothetical protein
MSERLQQSIIEGLNHRLYESWDDDEKRRLLAELDRARASEAALEKDNISLRATVQGDTDALCALRVMLRDSECALNAATRELESLKQSAWCRDIVKDIEKVISKYAMTSDGDTLRDIAKLIIERIEVAT